MKSILFVLLLVLTATVTAQDEPPIPDAGGGYVDVNGVSLYVIDLGDPSAPAVILLHGFGGSVVTWRFAIPVLVEAGYRVVAFDRPPYGLADKDIEVGWDAESYNTYTVDLMDALGIDRAVLVGHSAGGAVIANLWATHPERITALVFVAGAVITGDPEADAWFNSPNESTTGSGFGALASSPAGLDPNSPLAQLAVRAILTPQVFADILNSTFFDPSKIPADSVEAYGRVLQQPRWEAAFIKLFTAGMPENIYTPEDLTAVTVPTLLLWGEEDTWVSPRVGTSLVALIPGAELVTYESTGHVPMEEQPEWFNRDLLAFLDRVTLDDGP